jgi:phosphopantothenoylcysteine decarboxylase / phosphopantothenate---cysteine ligase
VTAGPTCENLDPVRYLTNRSSGKMGYALADAAARRGARVVLVSGPTALEPAEGVARVDVRSTEEMHRAVLAHAPAATIVIMAAAVADYRAVAPQTNKIKRTEGHLTLELEATPDILADVARGKGDRILVGFAAETDRVAERARQKLAAKSADLIVANDVTEPGAGFDHETNIVTMYARDGSETSLPQMSKFEVAQHVLDAAIRLRQTSLRGGALAAHARAADVGLIDKSPKDASSTDASSTGAADASPVVPAKTR